MSDKKPNGRPKITQVNTCERESVRIGQRNTSSSYRIPLPHVGQESFHFKPSSIGANGQSIAAKSAGRLVVNALKEHLDCLRRHLKRVVVWNVMLVRRGIQNQQMRRCHGVHEDCVGEVGVANPPELEVVVILRSLCSYYLLDHVSELKFMGDELVQLVLLDHSQHEILLCLSHLVEILSSDFGEGWKLFLAHPSVER